MLPESARNNDPEQQFHAACAELSQRLRAGEDCRAERLLDAYPQLSSNPSHILELILSEFFLRRELGQQPNPSHWLERFPQWREDLLRRLPPPKSPGDSQPADPLTVEQTPATTPETVLTPKNPAVTLGRYELLDKLGEGGMGVVYEAWDPTLKRTVALKVLRAGVLASSEEVQRFYREAQTGANLKHPNIVPILDVGPDKGQDFFVMEFVTGGSLADHRERFQADPREAACLMEKIACAVQFLHEEGILHRDLKPGNILLDAKGEPKVSDFGLAKFVQGGLDLTRPRQVPGTPAYMAPELVSGDSRKASIQTDVWALGVILYELLTGQRPFGGKTDPEIYETIKKTDPVRPSKLRPGMHRDLETIVMKCLEKEPARRYPSAQMLADDLQNWREGKPIWARPVGSLRKIWRLIVRNQAACLLLGVFGLGVAVPVGIYLAKPERQVQRTDPDRLLRAIQQKLAKGEAATLIGDKGLPAWFRWIYGEAALQESPNGDRTCYYNTLEFALLELLPDPQIERYRFSAEVRHVDTAKNGEVGLFFMHSIHSTPKGVEHCFCTLTFNDHESLFPLPDSSRASQVALYLRRARRVGGNQRTPGGAGNYFQPARRSLDNPIPWRKIAVEVTPKAVRIFWEGRQIGEVERKALRQQFLKDLTGPPINPQFAPREGLGLFISSGSASFRHVVVEPLDS
jgi:predicted Ser/Thr protein kinase